MTPAIQLTSRNTAAYPTGVTKAHAIEMSVQRLESLAQLHALVMNDSHAITFQSFGQYRTALAAVIAGEMCK